MARARSKVSQCARPVGLVNAEGMLNSLRPRGAQRAVQLGEANVVADGEAELPGGRVHHHGARSRGDVRGFPIAAGASGLNAGPTRDIHVEEMNLVIAAGALAVRAVNQRGRGDATILARAQGYGAAYDRHTQL